MNERTNVERLRAPPSGPWLRAGHWPLRFSSSSPPSVPPAQAEEGSEVSHPRPLGVLLAAELRARRRFPGRTLGWRTEAGRPERGQWCPGAGRWCRRSGFCTSEGGPALERAASGAGMGPFPQLWHPHSEAEWYLLSEPDFLGSNPGSATYWLCNLGHALEPLFASVSSPGR